MIREMYCMIRRVENERASLLVSTGKQSQKDKGTRDNVRMGTKRMWECVNRGGERNDKKEIRRNLHVILELALTDLQLEGYDY